MIRQRLSPPIQRVKRITRKRRRHNPLVVRLMAPLVYRRVMETSMDPVDTRISEEDEKRVLEEAVAPEWGLGGEVVEFGVAV